MLASHFRRKIFTGLGDKNDWMCEKNLWIEKIYAFHNFFWNALVSLWKILRNEFRRIISFRSINSIEIGRVTDEVWKLILIIHIESKLWKQHFHKVTNYGNRTMHIQGVRLFKVINMVNQLGYECNIWVQ